MRTLQKLSGLSIALTVCLMLTPQIGHSADPIKFGVPPWPGVTVKTEVASQLLKGMGYDVEQLGVSPSFIFKSLQTGDLNAYLGGWSPQEDTMIDPLVEKGAIEKVTMNLSDAVTGLAVPTYVWEAGVKSIKDLDANGDKFKRQIFSIETGSGINEDIQKVIDGDVAGLGDWEMVESNTAAMLSQAESKMKDKDWVVFFAWKPHWMNIQFDIKYLENVPGAEKIANKRSVVYTILPAGFAGAYPQAYTFFKQYQVPSEVQSEWVYEHTYKERSPEDVASAWIEANRDHVEKWLKGIKTLKGDKTAIQAVYE